ncbi:MAG TPA: endopeptidase La [Caulobacteraceae bacterium]|jgi:ATP-dependent Lon protease|nr:endopeptidase La [Caulobacteraceae bacterium]
MPDDNTPSDNTASDNTAAANPDQAAGPVKPLPSDAFLVVPVRNVVLFPEMIAPITVGRPQSIAAAQQAVREQRQVLVVLQRDDQVIEPGLADLHEIGVVANILRYVTGPEGEHHLICQGVQRFRISELLEGWPYLVARGLHVPEPTGGGPEVEARFLNVKQQALEAFELIPQLPEQLRQTVQAITAPGVLADMTATYIDARPEEKQDILETVDLSARLDKVSALLANRLQVLRLSAEINQRTQAAFGQRQREAVLREQLAAIQRELGEGEGGEEEIAELSAAIDAAKMPPEVEAQARKELRRLQRTPEASVEHGMIRSYLDLLLELPWAPPEPKPIDIAEARRILDQDHFGLEKIKERIIEYLAVRKLAPAGKAPILCFVGPPGVGKTSLGQSIARAMDRKFARISLGGVHDEAEIRGHRRTYVGALPGNIIEAIRKVGVRDCVIMLDEIDKLGAGIQGDPSAALLEVLDPEQNATFRDNYLGVPFDLSQIVFIATANLLDTVPGPLRDRMEIIALAGYTAGEKLEIAKRYLTPKQLKANGLTPDQVEIDDDALRLIITAYTREAGVRSLEREIGRALRHVAVRIAEGSASHVRIAAGDLVELLGQPRFENEVAMRTSIPGVATGLAWTPVGGDILFIEAAKSPGRGQLILTGQLGDVMKESAQAALSLVKSESAGLGLDPAEFAKNDIHVHVPAGATPKDGPSAGVAMFMALASLLTGRNVRSDTAMTGEISLRGLVLPVGGIKEKVVAAAAAGLTRVMLPARNRRDFDEIPREAREKLEFVWLEKVDDAVAAGLEPTAAEPAATGESKTREQQRQPVSAAPPSPTDH